MVYPTREFREYVRMLRKIERSPAEAPMTASAVRSLERMRKNKAASLLTESRTLATDQGQPALGDGHNDNAEQGDASYPQDVSNHENGFVHFVSTEAESGGIKKTDGPKRTVRERVSNDKEQPDRKTISEVLRDIYDENVH